MPFRSGSLPCQSPPKAWRITSDSLDDGRTVLGIGISAVHDAVLRGIARIPGNLFYLYKILQILINFVFTEPLEKEHPVTIYPGRSSPQKRVPPRTLPGSIERHREVCRLSNDKKSQESSQEFLVSIDNSSPISDDNLPPLSPSTILINHIFIHNLPLLTKCERNSDEFSDDSLEDTSLPPPPPPPIIPPPPSLSAPVTPSKRGSIAWELNLDDPSSFGDPLLKSFNEPKVSVILFILHYLQLFTKLFLIN